MNFLYVFNLLILCKCVIKFHFKTEYNPSNLDKSFNYYDYLTKNNLITEILIGNPPQKIPVTIKLNTESFYLTKSKGLFNSEKSTTFYSNFEEEKVSDEKVKKAYIAQDNMNLNFTDKEKTISNISFLYATEPNADVLNLGNIGLYYRDYSESKNLNLIFQLKKKDIIDNYAYSFHYINNNEGYFYIGDYPHNYNQSYYDNINFFYIKISLTFVWSSDFYNVTFGNEIINEKQFEINTTLGGIIGVKSLYNNIDTLYFKQKINDNKCKINTGKQYTYYECNRDLDVSDFPKLSFYHKDINFTFVLTYEDLFEVINDKLYCKLIFQNNINTRWNLGIPFLKKYMMTFDQNKKLFGFYKELKEKRSIFSLFNIICFILFLIIIFLIIFLIKYINKKQRRVRANEIEEDIDYTPINA